MEIPEQHYKATRSSSVILFSVVSADPIFGGLT